MLFLSIVASAADPSAETDGPTPSDWVATIDALYGNQTSMAHWTWTSGEVELELRILRRGPVDTRVTVLEPASLRGVTTLSTAEGTVTHWPNLGQTEPLDPSLSEGSWMGTSLSNAAVARTELLSTHYVPVFLVPPNPEDPAAAVILKLTPRSDRHTRYRSLELQTTGDGLPRTLTATHPSGTVDKTTWSDVRPVDPDAEEPRLLPFRVTHEGPSGTTVAVLERFDPAPPLQGRPFTQQALTR